MLIDINNLTGFVVDEDFLKEATNKVLKGERMEEKRELSIVLIGKQEMKALNRRFRNKDRATDVLAFSAPSVMIENKERKRIEPIGEIIICPAVVKENARSKAGDFQRELILCLIHGILHLLGYEHESNEAKAIEMKTKQNYYLNLAGFN